MNNIDRIYRYARDFDIKRENVISCLQKVSQMKNITFDQTSTDVAEYLDGISNECIDKAEKSNMKLKPYQELAVKHMLQNRGMIAAFDVGTGKTLTAVTVANCILNMATFFGKEVKVIVITPTSLQKNFKKEMTAYGSNPNDKRYSFYTTAKFGIDYKKGLVDCSKTLFIVDEAHVFRTDYRMQFAERNLPPKEDTRAEFAIICASKAWKVLLLTATPIYNKTHDIVNLLAMVRGEITPQKKDPYSEILSFETFSENYSGMILFQNSNTTEYPSRKDILLKIIMTPKYLQKYLELEKKIQHGMKNAEGIVQKNAFMVKLRTASNKLDICLKCAPAMRIIEKGEKTIFFSEFKSSGVEIIIEKLNEKGIEYYLISGNTSKKKRERIVDEFNSPGGQNLLIITKAGGEGLDLKGVRNVILFEKGWNISGENQVIGRAVRYMSHSHLPRKERNVIVWHLISVKPGGYNFDLGLEKVYDYDTLYVYEKYMKRDNLLDPEVIRRNLGKIAGADAYMFVQAIEKERKNIVLKNALERVQIRN